LPIAKLSRSEVYYEDSGAGEPLVFAAGLGRNHLSWSMVTPQFTNEWRCITFDSRGTGQSSRPPGPYTIDALADEAVELLSSLGIDSATWVGVSAGASLLQSLAARHPSRVKRMALISAFPRYTAVQDAWLDASLAGRRAGLDPLTSFLSAAPWVFTPRLLSDHAGLVRFAKASLGDPFPITLESFELHAQAVRTFDSRPLLPQITAPALVLTGAEDVLTPIEQAIEIAGAIPGATLHILPRGGHSMLAEYPEDVLRVVRRFLRPRP